MRAVILLAACTVASAQTTDPAYEALARAYESLRVRDYDAAVPQFLQAIAAAPGRTAIHKDLGYTYLKIGENELARAQFSAAMRLDPGDTQVALEYAFLCYESNEKAQARRIFDRIRRMGNPTAEQAFRNIDGPLAEGIERWKAAIAAGGAHFSAHFELATLAEQRDEAALAAEHFEKAWRLLPDRRSVLVDLGRVWAALGRNDDSMAALLAASRGGEPRAAELAREMLPNRYPFVPEFRRALELDPTNVELRREFAFLLLRMDRQPEAEREFEFLTANSPEDLLAATQLGFLLLARRERAMAQPLFDRVLAGSDDDLANRVRAVLHMPQVLRARPDPAPASIDAKVMAERSIKAGYMADAVKYLRVAHEADPSDYDVMLKLGWSLNILRRDTEAVRWFDLASHAPDPRTAADALRASRNLRAGTARFRTTAWFFPLYSTRWRDVFWYGQVRLEVRAPLGIRPYVSTRFIGDTRRTTGGAAPQYLSESSAILAGGVAANLARGITVWGEAGTALNYLQRSLRPDYRAGVSLVRAKGRPLRAESPGWFADLFADGVFLSRFGNDFLTYLQSRAGYTRGPAQFYWNNHVTFDVRSEHWANFVESGPGVRLAVPFLSPASWFSVNFLRGVYLVAPRHPFSDLRAGFWYGFSR